MPSTKTSPPHLEPVFFLHVDLDGLWTLPQFYGYPENYGGPSAFERDPVFELALPRLVNLFDELNVQAAFFVVGRDLELTSKRAALHAAWQAGHALANHSWSHRMDLEDLPEPQLYDEIERTNIALDQLTGERPSGFRAPGYTAGPRVLAAAARARLDYDGSALPTPWAPALRWSASRLRARVMHELSLPPSPLAGAARQYDGARFELPVMIWKKEPSAKLVRWPVAVSPVLRLPLQMSLGMLLGPPRMAGGLIKSAQKWGGPVTWLLHGLDALAPDEFLPRLPRTLQAVRALRFPLEQKLDAIRHVVRSLQRVGFVGCIERPRALTRLMQ